MQVLNHLGGYLEALLLSMSYPQVVCVLSEIFGLRVAPPVYPVFGLLLPPLWDLSISVLWGFDAKRDHYLQGDRSMNLPGGVLGGGESDIPGGVGALNLPSGVLGCPMLSILGDAEALCISSAISEDSQIFLY